MSKISGIIMKRYCFLSFIVIWLFSFSVFANNHTKSVNSKYNSFNLEIIQGINGCIGDWCKNLSPGPGFDFIQFNRISKHFGWGFDFHYGMFSHDDFDSVYYYSINVEGRAILPLGPIEFYTSTSLGYLTYIMNSNSGDEFDFTRLRATAPGFGLGGGIDFKISNHLKIGVFARVWLAIWSEACPSHITEGRTCVEPDTIKLDIMPWFAGLKLSYIFSY